VSGRTSDKAQDLGPVSNTEAYARARHWGRYMHRDGVVFKDRDGGWHCLAYCAASIKRAMLAVGTSGRFSVVGAGTGSTVRWREAIVRLRNARRPDLAC
jgi:hypothetical protein